jgi:hypothetical protein
MTSLLEAFHMSQSLARAPHFIKRAIVGSLVALVLALGSAPAAFAGGPLALYFYGPGNNTFVSVPSRTEISSFADSITVEARVYVFNALARQSIVSKRKDTSGGGGYELRVTPTGKLNFTTFSNTGAVKASIDSLVGLPNSNWVHVAGGFDAATGSIWVAVNGAYRSVSAANGKPAAGTTKLQLGRSLLTAGATNYLTGYIDNVHVSGVARYNGNFTPGCYDFDPNTRLLMRLDQVFLVGSTYMTPASGTGYSALGELGGSGGTVPGLIAGSECY